MRGIAVISSDEPVRMVSGPSSSDLRHGMSRRGLLFGLVSGLTTACAEISPLADEPLRPRRRLLSLAPDSGPISAPLPAIDFHTHLQKRITAEELVAKMDATGVARMVLMPLYYGDRPGHSVNDGEGSDEQAAEYAQRFPARFVPFVGMQRPELTDGSIWTHPGLTGRTLFRETEAKLRSGEFFGMGELMLRFYPYQNRHGIVAPTDMNYPPDSYLMHRFADLSARYRAPMVIHAEAEPAVTEGMLRLIEAHPEAIFVWAHNCGRSSAEAITAMMERFPNLSADLGGMVYSGPNVEHYGVYFPRRTPWMYLVVNEVGTILPEMQALFERHADRFFVGTDIAHARVYAYYVNHWPRWRRFFAQLSSPAARKIAYENAERLFAPA
jgi:hypothetical protein